MTAGKTVSFIATEAQEDRVKEIARVDGVTKSQAAARSFTLGALPSTAARRAARFILEQGGEDARRELSMALAKAIGRTSNAVLEKQLLAQAAAQGTASTATEDELEAEAVEAVILYRNERQAG